MSGNFPFLMTIPTYSYREPPTEHRAISEVMKVVVYRLKV